MEEQINKWLKFLKLNEDKISMGLGVVVVVLVAGMVFRYFNQVGKKNQPEVSATSTKQLAATVEGSYYVVRPGDDLGKIAEAQYGRRDMWREIANANKLNNPDLIEVGEKLIIPPVGKNVQSRELELEKGQTPDGQNLNEFITISGNEYVVQRGDLLWGIAVRAYGDGFRWKEIAEVNKLDNPDILEPGLVLVLPR